MNLYIIEAPDGWRVGECDFAIVAAESEEIARHIHPNSSIAWDPIFSQWRLVQFPKMDAPTSWPHPEKVIVTRIGLANASLTCGVVRAAHTEL
jgi:hypothetical protein